MDNVLGSWKHLKSWKESPSDHVPRYTPPFVKCSQTVRRKQPNTNIEPPKAKRPVLSINFDDLVSPGSSSCSQRSHLSQMENPQLDQQLGLQSGSVVSRKDVSTGNITAKRQPLPKPSQLRSHSRCKKVSAQKKATLNHSILAFDEHISSLRRKTANFQWNDSRMEDKFRPQEARVLVKREQLNSHPAPASDTSGRYPSSPEFWSLEDWMDTPSPSSQVTTKHLLWDTDDVPELQSMRYHPPNIMKQNSFFTKNTPGFANPHLLSSLGWPHEDVAHPQMRWHQSLADEHLASSQTLKRHPSHFHEKRKMVHRRYYPPEE